MRATIREGASDALDCTPTSALPVLLRALTPAVRGATRDETRELLQVAYSQTIAALGRERPLVLLTALSEFMANGPDLAVEGVAAAVSTVRSLHSLGGGGGTQYSKASAVYASAG